VTKFSRRSGELFQKYEAELNCGKMPYLKMLKYPLKFSLDPDIEVDDFQNVISSSLFTDTTN